VGRAANIYQIVKETGGYKNRHRETQERERERERYLHDMFWRHKRREATGVVAGGRGGADRLNGKQVQQLLVPDNDEPVASGSGEETMDIVMDEGEQDSGDADDDGMSETDHDKNVQKEDAQGVNVNDEENFNHISPEELLARKRREAMRLQKVQETQALGRNSFCKNQRVRYLHKASGRRYEAVIVDVHFDDGIDRPYFTVRYHRQSDDNNGGGQSLPEMIEKQTTSDRLSYVSFDEAKTYEIISSKIKL